MSPIGSVQCRKCRCDTDIDLAVPASKVIGGGKRGWYCLVCAERRAELFGSKV